MIFVYGRDKMTDKEKLSLWKHPEYPGIHYELRTELKSGYEYYKALDPDVAVEAGLRKTYYRGFGSYEEKAFEKELVPVYKVVLA